MTEEEVGNYVKNLWMFGRKTKRSSSGWISGNCPCCAHNGETPDKRMRGGLLVSRHQISYSCFNCKFKASWTAGRKLSYKMRKFLEWSGASSADISKIELAAQNIELPDDYEPYVPSVPTFRRETLPPGSNLLSPTSKHQDAKEIYEYAKSRGLLSSNLHFFWSMVPPYNRRLIIPYVINDTLVGWNSRAIDKNVESKYIAKFQTGFIFNYDAQRDNREVCVLVEGEIDAVRIDAMALKGSEISDSQHELLKLLNKKIVVVPDRDSAGHSLVESALKRGYYVSMPPWDDKINDVDDAVNKYGKLYTLYSILSNATNNKLKAELTAKKWIRKKHQ
jgi:hypothetical protein